MLPRNYRLALQRAIPIGCWGAARPYVLPSASPSRVGPYYIDWHPGDGPWGESWTSAPFDGDGVILTPRGDRYHPVRIAQYGLHRHREWLADRTPASRAAFLAQAAWLRRHQTRRAAAFGAYPYDFDVPAYGAKAGWISAMAQGEAISLLLRAHDAEPEVGFLSAARAATEPFRVDVGAGGVRWRTSDGDTFFEEYATGLGSHVLNGFIYALWGLWELERYDPTGEVHEPLLAGLETLRRRLRLYDAGYWSHYDLVRPAAGPLRPAPFAYHALHVAQLRVTAAMTHDDYYEHLAGRWAAYQESAACRVRFLAASAGYYGARILFDAHLPQRGAVSRITSATTS